MVEAEDSHYCFLVDDYVAVRKVDQNKTKQNKTKKKKINKKEKQLNSRYIQEGSHKVLEYFPFILLFFFFSFMENLF